MKFKIDENLPTELKGDFVTIGHDAETVVDENLTGVSDPQLVQVIHRTVAFS